MKLSSTQFDLLKNGSKKILKIAEKIFTNPWFKIFFIMALTIRVLRIDFLPMVSNDSVLYIDWGISRKFLDKPLQIIEVAGLKSAGYPLMVTLYDWLAPYFGFDTLTFAVLFQRFAFLISYIWMFLLIGPLSIPLFLVVLTSPFYMVTSNMLLTEGITVPAGILLSCSVIHLANLTVTRHWKSFLKWAVLWFLALACYSIMVLCKFNLAAFSLLLFYPLLKNGIFIPIKKWNWNFASNSLLLIVLIGSSYIFALVHYNYVTTGSLAPTSAVGRVFYWGTWHAVFAIRPENREKPGLKEIYDSGSLYNVINETATACSHDMACETPILIDKCLTLLEKAEMNIWQERLRSFSMAMLSGEKNELHGNRKSFLASNGQPSDGGRTWVSNGYTDSIGTTKALIKLNHGKDPHYIRGLGGKPIDVPRTDGAQKLYAGLIYLLGLFLLIRRKLRLFDLGVIGCISFAFVSLSVSLYLMDIWRFVQTGWVVCMLLLTYELKMVIDRERQKRSSQTI